MPPPGVQVRVKVLFSGVGPVSQSDVQLAAAAGATVLAFNVRAPGPAVEAEAKKDAVRICSQRIIYRLLEEARLATSFSPPLPRPFPPHTHRRAAHAEEPCAVCSRTLANWHQCCTAWCSQRRAMDLHVGGLPAEAAERR